MKRPLAATLLAVIAVIAGIVAVVDTLRYLRILPVATFGDIDFYGGSIFGAIMTGLVAIIWFWAAARIWAVDPQGWLFMVSIAAIYLIFDVIALIFGNPFAPISASFWITLLALILCILPGTKQAFGQPQ